MQRAWSQVRRNNGAPGIDQITLVDVEEYGVSRLLDELEAELKAGAYRPLAARRVFIPKPGTNERRPSSSGQPHTASGPVHLARAGPLEFL